ncbi:MAG: hypothetical protein ACLP3Q_04965 [Streptosporangiaceae bacterium]
MNERIHPGRTRVEWEPQLPQRALISPRRGSAPIHLRKMLREPGKEDIPTLVTRTARLFFKQFEPSAHRLVPVIL